MSKFKIFCGLSVILFAFLAKQLSDFGVFRRIETTGLDQCRLIVPSDGEDQAFEDLTIDYKKGVAYMGGDDRGWFHTYSKSIQNMKKQGTFFMFDIQSEKFKKFKLVKYPFQHFHPLGISLLKGKKGLIFMTNFRSDSGEIVGAVDIFKIDSSKKNALVWIDSVVHPLFTVPDDVLAIDEKTFYVTMVYHHTKDKSELMHHFEIATKRPWTYTLLCSKTNEWKCSKVVDSLLTANGIAASSDFKTVYIAETVHKRILVFDRNLENNSLTYMQSIFVPFFVDNLIIDENGRLIVAGHPKLVSFVIHEGSPRQYRAPSEVVIFHHPKTNATYETLLLTNGELLSASTVGGTYKQKLLVGGLLDPGILLCQNAS